MTINSGIIIKATSMTRCTPLTDDSVCTSELMSAFLPITASFITRNHIGVVLRSPATGLPSDSNGVARKWQRLSRV